MPTLTPADIGEISRSDLYDYLFVQSSGVTNMSDVKRVSTEAGISPEKVACIMQNYELLCDEYRMSVADFE